MNKTVFFFLCILFLPVKFTPGQEVILDPFVLDELNKFNSGYVQRIETGIDNFLKSNDEKILADVLWASEVTLYNPTRLMKTIHSCLLNFDDYSNNTIRALLEAAYTLFPNEFKDKVSIILNKTDNPKIFAMAANYLMKNNVSNELLLNNMRQKFPEWEQQPILYSLSNQLATTTPLTPPLRDLFYADFGGANLIIFSIQRKNRDYPGIVIARYNGTFINSGNKILAVPQLARSISNLPGYLTNGNTPQGIFTILGTDNSKNIFIGPTTNIQTALPFEVPAQLFFHDSTLTDSAISLEQYKALLPSSWKNYTPIQEAYYAGKAGRNEIIAHGTTISSHLYKGKTYYPNTPTQGCLCIYEEWDMETGKQVVSDQQRFIRHIPPKAFHSRGYLIVVEIDDAPAPVKIDDIISFLRK